MSTLQPRGRKRGVALLLAAALIVAGSIAASQTTSSRNLVAPSPEPVALATSGTAYCPVTAAEGEGATLVLASVGEADSEVVLTRYADGIGTSEAVELLPAGTSAALPIAAEQLSQPITIDWRGSPVLAQYQLTDGDEALVANCASQPSLDWYLPGFDTSLGSISLLHLFNPFGQDALVSLSFGTPEGRVELLIADELLIPAGDSTILNLAQFRPEATDLAVTVSVRAGRVVPQGQIQLAPAGDNVEGLTGRALITAVPVLSEDVVVAQATVDEITSSWLTVYNPGERAAAVQVQVSTPLGDASTLASETNIPPGGTTRIDLASLSALPSFGVRVTSVNGVGVAVSRTTALQDDQRAGITIATAAPAVSSGWVVAGAAPPDGTVTLYNPGTDVATADVAVGGDRPETWTAVNVPPNGTTALLMSQASPQGPAVVTSDVPLVAGVVNLRPESATAYWAATGVATDSLTGGAPGLAAQRESGLSSIPAISATATPTPVAVDPEADGEGGLGPAPEPSATATPTDPTIEPPIVPDDLSPTGTPQAPATSSPVPAPSGEPSPGPTPLPPGTSEQEGSLFGKQRAGRRQR